MGAEQKVDSSGRPTPGRPLRYPLKLAGALEHHVKLSAVLVTVIAIGLSGALGSWSRSVFMGKLLREDLSGTCTRFVVQTRVLFSPHRV